VRRVIAVMDGVYLILLLVSQRCFVVGIFVVGCSSRDFELYGVFDVARDDR